MLFRLLPAFFIPLGAHYRSTSGIAFEVAGSAGRDHGQQRTNQEIGVHFFFAGGIAVPSSFL